MATPKPQPTRALQVIPSPLCDIPNPALFITDAVIVLIEEGNKFTVDSLSYTLKELGLKAGDILYATGAGAATITSVISDYTFTINIPNNPLDPTQTVNIPCTLYGGQDDNQGCVLYVGTGGGVETITAGGDIAIYNNVPNGQIIPVQTKAVTKVEEADNIIALW